MPRRDGDDQFLRVGFARHPGDVLRAATYGYAVQGGIELRRIVVDHSDGPVPGRKAQDLSDEQVACFTGANDEYAGKRMPVTHPELS